MNDRAPPNEYTLALTRQRETDWSDPAAAAEFAQIYWPVIERALALAASINGTLH